MHNGTALGSSLFTACAVLVFVPCFGLDTCGANGDGVGCGRTSKVCNWTVPWRDAPQLSKSKTCLATPIKVILSYFRHLGDVVAKSDPELPLSFEAGFYLIVLALAQCELDVIGGIAEVGSVFSKGFLSFHHFSLLRRGEERLFMCGPCAGERDNYQSLEEFDLRDAVVGQPAPNILRISRPGKLTDTRLMDYSEGTGFRIFRIDRTTGANETAQLLTSAACSLVDGGVVLLEGIQHMMERPAVQEGFHRFLLSDLPPKKRLLPFLWAGRSGGIFLAQPYYALLFRRRVTEALLRVDRGSEFVTKPMHGSEVLISWWRADIDAFVEILGAHHANL